MEPTQPAIEASRIARAEVRAASLALDWEGTVRIAAPEAGPRTVEVAGEGDVPIRVERTGATVR